MPMKITRRQFIAHTGISLAATALPLGAFASSQKQIVHPLQAAPGNWNLTGEEGSSTNLWQYNQSTPGPVIRVKQGQRISIPFKNRLDQPTTVHWHGLRIDNSMDGVPDLTQPLIQPGETFNYEFTPPDAGTYWYHPHNRTWEQLARGLYGILIVEEQNPIQVDQDLVLAVDDWLINKQDQIHEQSFGSLHDWSHRGRLGNYLTVNGHPKPQFKVQQGERIRLRIINTANARIMPLQLNGLEATTIALDGQPIKPEVLGDGKFQLAPSQRIDLIVDATQPPGERATLEFNARNNNIVIATFEPTQRIKREQLLDTPIALEDNPLPTEIPLTNAQHFPLLMEGGAMGGMEGAHFEGQWLDIRQLIQNKKAWALNGTAGLPDKPLFSVKRGQSVTVELDNQNRWPHAMHIHGHHFKVVSKDGTLDSPWRDTTLIDAGDKQRLVFVADNPGKWLIHCHMVEHSAAGMITWFEVT